MLKIKSIWVCICISLSCVAGEKPRKLVKIAPEDILFLSHFNSSLMPEVGNAKNMACRSNITSGQKGFPFKDSAPRAECLDVSVYRSFLALSGANNIDIRHGTLQFWIKPMWSQKDYVHAIFFKLCDSPETRGRSEWQNQNSFYIQKPPRLEQFRLSHVQRSIIKDIQFGSIWHQIAATWSADKKIIKFYIDGELVGSEKYLVKTPPDEILFGVPSLHCAKSLIDEARILKRILTDSEIKQDFLAQKSGLEFISPPAQQRSGGLYKFKAEMPNPASDKKGILENVIFPVYYTSAPPQIDGKLNEEIWKYLPELPGMRTRNGHPAKVLTGIKLCYDNKYIYIAGIANEPSMKTIVANYDQRDLPVYSDDCVEFIIQPSGRTGNYYHFIINSLGTIYDAKNSSRNYDATGIKVKTARLNDRWLLEVAIPFKDLQTISPQNGSAWGARFCRERHNSEKEYSSVPTVKHGSFSSPAFLGKLCFKSKIGSKALISGKVNSEKFLPGWNSLELTLDNSGVRNFDRKIVINYFNAENELLKNTSEAVSIKIGRQKIKIPLKIMDDRIERVSINIQNNNGANDFGIILNRAFIPASSSIKEVASELEYFQANLKRYADVKHPIYNEVVRAVKITDEAVKKYLKRLKNAIDSKRTLKEEHWNEIVSIINGFNKFKEYRRYLIWETSPWEKGSEDALAPMNYTEKPIFYFNQAVNEQEAVCFIISGLLCKNRLDLRIHPYPVDKSDNFISGKNFTVYTEPIMKCMGRKITSALIKVPGNIITVTPGNSQRIWIIFDSGNVRPGKYLTKLVVKPLYDYSVPDRDIPVHLRIFNFKLPETNEWPLDCYLWSGGLGRLDELAMLKTLHKHHIKWSMTESHKYIHGFKRDRLQFDGIGKKDFDPDKVKYENQEFFETAKKLKMKIVFAWGTHSTVKWHQMLIKRLRDMGFGYKDFIFHGGLLDEFRTKDIPDLAEFRKKMLQADDKAQFMATLLSAQPPVGTRVELLEKTGLLKFFKVWAVNYSVKLKVFNELLEKNRIVWAYRCNYNMQIRDILDYYRFFPWWGYMNKLNGIAYWTFASSRSFDGFDHRDGYDDGITLIDNDHKPVPTKQFEALREGLEDVAYMDILRKTLAKAEKSNPGKDYSKYQKLLKDIPLQIMQDKSQDALDDWRIKVGEAIEQLSK